MKRTVLMVAVAALCVAGSAVAEDSGQMVGSGGYLGSGNAAGQTLGSGGFLGSGTRSEDGGYLGSGNRTTDDAGGVIGSGTRTTAASGGLIGSGTRTEDNGQVLGSGASVTAQDGGYLIGGGRGGYYGSGLSVRQLRLMDGSSLLVVSSDEGMFVIPLEE